MLRRTLFVCAYGLLGLVGCVSTEAQEVRYLGAGVLHCPADLVSAYETRKGPYVAKGCGRWVFYDCVSTRYATRCFPHAEPVVHGIEPRPTAPDEHPRAVEVESTKAE
jgi:hypothetical protein